MINTLFVDRITLTSLFRIFLLRFSVKSIWYFESPDKFANRILSILLKLGLIRASIMQIEYNMGHVHNQFG
jgi:hypothetical protein